jgi:hypothetical protein
MASTKAQTVRENDIIAITTYPLSFPIKAITSIPTAPTPT